MRGGSGGRPGALSTSSRITCSAASTSAAAGAVKSRSAPPSASATRPAATAASSLRTTLLDAGLCAMAAANSPAADGVAISVVTALPPADSPKTVTRPGSPPKAAMLSRTHSSAAIWSRSPRLLSTGRSGVAYRVKSR